MRSNMTWADGFTVPASKRSPLGDRKIDWTKALEICRSSPKAEVYAGLQEDWQCTKGKIFSNGVFTTPKDGCYASRWATPIIVIVDRDGRETETECWIASEKDIVDKDMTIPGWWKKNNDISA